MTENLGTQEQEESLGKTSLLRRVLLTGAFLGTFFLGYKLGQKNPVYDNIPVSPIDRIVSNDETQDDPKFDIEEDAEDYSSSSIDLDDKRMQRSFEESQRSLEESYKRVEHDLKRHYVINEKWILSRDGIFEDGTPFGNMASLTYLLNQEGEPVSPGFEDIIPTDEGYVGVLLYRYTRLDNNGRTLEEKFDPNFSHPKTEEERLLRDQYLSTKAVVIPEKFETKRFFHETGRLSDGTRVGNIGACWYILDNDGNPVSGGFHEINPTSEGYIGELGAGIVRLNKNGRPTKRKFTEIFPK